MNKIELAHLQALAKMYDAQHEWLAMEWNVLTSLQQSGLLQMTPREEKTEQLSLPGF